MSLLPILKIGLFFVFDLQTFGNIFSIKGLCLIYVLQIFSFNFVIYSEFKFFVRYMCYKQFLLICGLPSS